MQNIVITHDIFFLLIHSAHIEFYIFCARIIRCYLLTSTKGTSKLCISKYKNLLDSVQMLSPFHHHDQHSFCMLEQGSTCLNSHIHCLVPRHLQDNLRNQSSSYHQLEVAVQLLDSLKQK